MSRLIIKNLPAYVTPARLKDHFSQKDGPGGTLTDVKVALQPDGTSRRFGFVGFKTDREATEAREWFDRTYIGTTRIHVQVVETGAKNAPTPRPNKRPRLAASSNDAPTSHQKKKDVKVDDNVDADPSAKQKGNDTHLNEFLQVMQPRTKKGRSWTNEDAPSASPSASLPGQSKSDTNAKQNPAVEKSDDTQDIVMGDESANVDEVDDAEWMRRRMGKGLQISEENEERVFQQDDGDDDTAEKEDDKSVEPATDQQADEAKDTTKETIIHTCRLFLRNLPFSCTESELQDLFSPYGDIVQVHVALDSATKTSKGLAFVTFAKGASALAAYEALDKVSFQGRLLHILPAVDRKSGKAVEEGDDKPKTVKGEKEKKRKETASREFNWSMLYMNSDAVASSIADRMNITKSDILNPQSIDGENTSAAVKLALAETHIIQETKNYLESEGINISAFSSMASATPSIRQCRSDTCILVKNIPYGTTVEQIREMFEPHGELSHVLVPPAGTIAVVEFVQPDDASKAFRAVSYRRMGSSIVYLEKAPVGVFEPAASGSKGASKSKPKTDAAATKPITIPEQDEGESDTEEASTTAGSTLFVKNLSFATTADRLTQVFKHLPSFAFARIQTKPDPKAPPGVAAPRLSMGYGFVGFKTSEAAKKAILSMQGFVLDGHSLHVKFAARGVEEEEGKGKEKAGSRTTKMIVKNVPFEASKKEIRELFGAHGQLKSVRLPKKFDTRSRGFAFLDFISRQEAENAYAALRHTHLLGRHLVLDWAEDNGQDVDVLRQKAGVGFGGGAELPNRKRKLNFGEKDDIDDAKP